MSKRLFLIRVQKKKDGENEGRSARVNKSQSNDIINRIEKLEEVMEIFDS
jgi:hypothetical protein